ncbi:hypothetical protein PMAYCL1PPCAC_25028, partial [Pristionchus mayeri]
FPDTPIVAVSSSASFFLIISSRIVNCRRSSSIFTQFDSSLSSIIGVNEKPIRICIFKQYNMNTVTFLVTAALKGSNRESDSP